jgi:hypothetical protein
VPHWSRASHIALSFISPTIDYHAGGDAQVDIHRLEDASLFLSAHLFDTIAELAPILDGGVSSNNSIKALDPAHAKEDWQRLLDLHQLILNSTYVWKPYQHTNPPQTAEELFRVDDGSEREGRKNVNACRHNDFLAMFWKEQCLEKSAVEPKCALVVFCLDTR